MSDQSKVTIRRLPTGVPGLDPVLGGGLPEYSFNLIVGEPGSGKTTLAQQITFANASPDRPALYFTVLGEPLIKMLRYQQQFNFFDLAKVDASVRFRNLSQEVLDRDLAGVQDRIVREVEEANPGIVVVDSFRTVLRAGAGGEADLHGFVERLALLLAGWQATTFLIGEYGADEMPNNPAFTIADGVLWLIQSVERNSVVRKLRVVKMRGQAPMSGLMTFRITNAGLEVFPRLFREPERSQRRIPRRISSGIPTLDAMMNGGIPAGDSVLVAGPSGSGKTVLSTQFIVEGLRQGEPGIIAVFEEHPEDYLRRASSFGFDLAAMVRQGTLQVMYLRHLDLSMDETLRGIQEAVERIRAKRVVIDSITAVELALAPGSQAEFREALYRMIGVLTGLDVTVLLTVEVPEAFTSLSLSPHAISFLADDIILQRYVELDSRLRRVITVVKMRGSAHSTDLRAYEVTDHGLVVGDALREYQGIITGIPVPRAERVSEAYPGLSDQERAVLRALIDLGQASAADITHQTGLQRAVVTHALGRLAALQFVRPEGEPGHATYRPVARDVPGG